MAIPLAEVAAQSWKERRAVWAMITGLVKAAWVVIKGLVKGHMTRTSSVQRNGKHYKVVLSLICSLISNPRFE